MDIGTLVAIITSAAALIAIGVYRYNQGHKEGTLSAMVDQLKEVVPQILDIQKALATACQQISEHTSDLDRGSAKMEAIRGEISDLKERITRVETILKIPPS